MSITPLIGTMPNGCKETATRAIKIDLGPIKNEIVLSDSSICYGSGAKLIHAKVDKTGLTNINWYLDNKKLNDHNASIDFLTDDSMMLPGYHYVKCEFFRGNCSTSLVKVIHVRGPVASFEIFNFNGCLIPDKRIFFISQSTFDPKFTTFSWTIADANGDNCTTNRSKKINVSEYCNMAVDSFAVHRYRDVLDQSEVTFVITDTKSGCSDEVTQIVVNKCSRLCQPNTDEIHICLGEKIFDEAPEVKLPYKISFDNGLKWYNYPVSSDSIGVGVYNMTVVFMETFKRWPELYNNDSFEIKSGLKAFYDTLKVKNKYDCQKACTSIRNIVNCTK